MSFSKALIEETTVDINLHGRLSNQILATVDVSPSLHSHNQYGGRSRTIIEFYSKFDYSVVPKRRDRLAQVNGDNHVVLYSGCGIEVRLYASSHFPFMLQLNGETTPFSKTKALLLKDVLYNLAEGVFKVIVNMELAVGALKRREQLWHL